MVNVFIIYSSYQLLITIVKTFLTQRIGKDELIICDADAVSSKLIQNIQHLFKNIIIINQSKTSAYFHILLWRNRITRRIPFFNERLKKYLGLDETFFHSKNIFIYNDFSALGCLLNISKTKYNLIEDGLNFFQRDPLYTIKTRCRYSHVWDSLLGVSWKAFGQSKYTISIEVNDESNLYVKHNNIIISNRAEMFQQLSEEDIDSIAHIFDYHPLDCSFNGVSTLLLTQPLSEDNIMAHSKKIHLYKHLVDEYAVGKLYIKMHPREKENYSIFFPDAIILKGSNIPLEIFLLKEKFHFKRVVSICSTAMDAIFCADEKIQMGEKWMYETKI